MKHPLLAAVFVSLLTASCSLFTEYDSRFEGIESSSPLPVYAEWWASTEACSGLTGNFSLIEWFVADWITRDGAAARGAWRPPHEIIIRRGLEEDEYTVRHEMLHDLLSGDRDHTAAQWIDCELIST